MVLFHTEVGQILRVVNNLITFTNPNGGEQDNVVARTLDRQTGGDTHERVPDKGERMVGQLQRINQNDLLATSGFEMCFCYFYPYAQDKCPMMNQRQR